MSTLQLKAGDKCKGVCDSTIDTRDIFFLNQADRFLRNSKSRHFLSLIRTLVSPGNKAPGWRLFFSWHYCWFLPSPGDGTVEHSALPLNLYFPAFSFSAWPLTLLNVPFFHETKQKTAHLPAPYLTRWVWMENTNMERTARCTKNVSGFLEGNKPRFGSYCCCTRNCPSWSEGPFWNYVLQGSWQIFLTLPLLPSRNQQHYFYRIVVCKDQIKSFPSKQNTFTV